MPELPVAHTSKRALRALAEYDASLRGEVGVNGTIDPNGTRYSLNYLMGLSTYEKAMGTNWCVPFVKWNYAAHDGDPVGGKGFIDLHDRTLGNYFRDPNRDGDFSEGSFYNDGKGNMGTTYFDPVLSNTSTGELGDYLIHDGSMAHAGLFLAYDETTQTLWSIEGNVGNKVQVKSRAVSAKLLDPSTSGREYWTGIGRLQTAMFTR